MPGGLRDEGETLDVAADRELQEETGILASELENKRWLGEIEAHDWDSRTSQGAHVGVSHYHTNKPLNPVAGDDAIEAQWIRIEDIASGKAPLAFGHAHWLAQAHKSNPNHSQRLRIVSDASQLRNQRIIRKINERREQLRENNPEIRVVPTANNTTWGT